MPLPPAFTQFHPTSPNVTQPGVPGKPGFGLLGWKPGSPASPVSAYWGNSASPLLIRLRLITPKMQNPAQSRVVSNAYNPRPNRAALSLANKIRNHNNTISTQCKTIKFPSFVSSTSTPKTESDAELFGSKKIFEWSYKQPTMILPLNTITHLKWTQRGKAYVCISSLNQFYEFITENANFFESNVRDHERDATVNRGIRRTLMEGDNAPEEFWWLNNGITIVAAQIILDGDKFVLTDPLIVNGLQTSYEIANHFQQMKLAKDTRTILVRILETSNATAVDDVINATNSQTKIGRNSLHATEKIHRDIEVARASKTPKLFYERRKNYYRNRKVPIPTIITITEMAQILAAVVLQKPDDSRARPTTVVDRNYAKLFNKDYPLELYWVCGWILKKTEEFLDGLDLENAYKLNIKFYVAMYVTCLVLNSHNPRRSRISSLDISALNESAMKESFQIVDGYFIAAGKDDRAAKGPALAEHIREELKLRFIKNYSKKDQQGPAQ